ncbi:MAG TPA: hypothetical protein VM687_03305 [Stenotrophomonas sp.]|nr:hypothetical protein [Stenotrophomonas sp.]
MKSYSVLLAILLATFPLLTTANPATAPSDAQIDRQLLDQRTATINNQAALDAYLAKEPLQSPLRKLTHQDRRAFLGSLVFGGNGLGSYDYTPLLNADFLDAYRILRLFGSELSLTVVLDKFKPSNSRTGRSVATMLKRDAGLSALNSADSECWQGTCRARLGHICVAGGC